MYKILDIIHNTIYQFFDVCDDNEEVPISDKDKLLLEVNKAICNNLKALEQEPCGDWYDVPSNEMTLKQARQAVKDLRKKLMEYLEQEPCEDAISRQAVMDAMRKNRLYGGRDIDGDYIECVYRECLYDDIQSLPPVTLKQKTGRWVIAEDSNDRFFVTYECSCCKRAIIVPYDARNEVYKDYPYCHCGAKMESEEQT